MPTFKISQSVSVEWRICDGNGEMVNISFIESKKNVRRLNAKSEERMKYIFPVDLAKYLSYLEVQKNRKVADA